MKNLSLIRTYKNQRGFSLLETLVAVTFLAVAALAVLSSTTTALRLTKRSIRNSVASQLATQKMEELAGVDPALLSSANSSIESAVVFNNMTFQRQTTVSVNSNGSRTINVAVQNVDAARGGRANLTNVFPVWGNQ